MHKKTKHIFFILVFFIFGIGLSQAQEETDSVNNNKSLYKKLDFYNLRGTNSIDLAAGTALLGGDFPDTKFEFYYRFGYKRHITEHLGIGLTFNKYNLAYEETFNEGFMSFDLNLEYLINPFNNISPFLYGGYGYSAANYFETTGAKLQGGAGIEFIVIEKLGIKLFGEYNYVFSNETEPVIDQETSISFLRLGLGVNLYFGGKKKRDRLLEQVETVIQSNIIK